MPRTFVLTLTGADRVGIVEELTGLLLERGGNVETSRMARLGGEFAVLMLVTIPEDRFEGLEAALAPLTDRGYRVTTAPTDRARLAGLAGWLAFRIAVHGADHEGIIHRVAQELSQQGISIESMETETAPAPFGGVPLFNMTARVAVPPALAGRDWSAGLREAADRMNLEATVDPLEVDEG